MKGREKSLELARKLGIPDDAERIIIFGESSHWDPNWLMTSKEYYRFRIRKILDQAIHELEAEPRRVFGIECVFFLKMFRERNPDKCNSIGSLVNVNMPSKVLPGFVRIEIIPMRIGGLLFGVARKIWPIG